MTLDAPRRLINWTGLVLLSLFVAGCDGDNGSAPPANAPVISDLAVRFLQRCTTGSGRAGTIESVTFSFTDADGDLAGGTVEDTSTPEGGAPLVLTGAIPSTGVSISGTTSGTITLTFCVRFGSVNRFTENVKVTDAADHQSNVLTATVDRPSGAPEMSGSADADRPGIVKSFGGR